jgi:hypothetical protein
MTRRTIMAGTPRIALLAFVAVLASAWPPANRAGEPLEYRIELTAAASGFDGETCWVHARAGAIPPGGAVGPG